MSFTVIKWSKKYCEDLGELDEAGFYDYAYCYFIYSFYLPDENRIVIKNYTDTILEGNLFVYKGNELDKVGAVNTELISAVIAFMGTKQNIVHFSRFDEGYNPIDLRELKNNPSSFSFLEIEAIE